MKSPRPRREPVKLQATLPAATAFVLDELAFRGHLGTSRADVAEYILTRWVEANDQFLKDRGINSATIQDDPGGNDVEP